MPDIQGLPYGENVQANQLMGGLQPPPSEDGTGYHPSDNFTPANPDEEFLTSATDRPNEPISHGAPWGTGPSVDSFTMQGETRNEFADRVATQMETNGEVPPGVKKFLDKVRQGL